MRCSRRKKLLSKRVDILHQEMHDVKKYIARKNDNLTKTDY